jgi:hypothetical protein
VRIAGLVLPIDDFLDELAARRVLIPPERGD